MQVDNEFDKSRLYALEICADKIIVWIISNETHEKIDFESQSKIKFN
jgi:hypothetical protein